MSKSIPGHAGRLAGLSLLTRMVLEMRLAVLRSAGAARQATQAALTALETPVPAPGDDLALAVVARADLLYDRWVERKRSDLNLRLARETALWLDQRDLAARAFGRNAVLQDLTADAIHARLVAAQKR